MSVIPKIVLCPVDFTPASDDAIISAADLARHFHASLCLAHVVPAIPPLAAGFGILHEGEYERKLHDDAAERLKDLVAKLRGTGLEVTGVVGEGNDVAGELLRIARDESAGLIVMPTHGMTGWHPLVFASITESVVKNAHCPVLVLRAAPVAVVSAAAASEVSTNGNPH
jgi:nucleotide-binding universal stress UspA family protein